MQSPSIGLELTSYHSPICLRLAREGQRHKILGRMGRRRRRRRWSLLVKIEGDE